MPSFPERIAVKSTEVQVVKILLTILALPFYVLGLLAAVVWVCLRWIFAAVLVGFSDIGAKSGGDDAS